MIHFEVSAWWCGWVVGAGSLLLALIVLGEVTRLLRRRRNARQR